MNVPTMNMLVGLPGSGKSVYAEKKKFFNNFVVCSSDEIRKNVFKDIDCQDNNAEVFKILHNDIKQNLQSGYNVIYDATNINARRRMAFLKEIEDIPCVKIATLIIRPYEVCLRNNWMRERKIPYDVIFRMYSYWQTPYYYEGWDEIVIERDPTEYVKNEPNLENYYEDNPYHTRYSLGEHMRRTKEYLIPKVMDGALWTAAAYHDIGKPFCREKGKNGYYHYYNHENVGAYDALSRYGLSLEVSALINNHMRPFSMENSRNPEKLRKEYRDFWGEDFYDKIMLLHEADVVSA